jgi:hypothetical protein
MDSYLDATRETPTFKTTDEPELQEVHLSTPENPPATPEIRYRNNPSVPNSTMGRKNRGDY